MKFDTIACHAGLCTDENTGALTTPIYQTSTFRHKALGLSTGYDYSRTGNPTRKALENTISELEKGNQGFAFSSGMAAIDAVIMSFSQNDHFIISDDLYGGTYRIFEKNFKKFGISTTFVDTADASNVINAITEDTKAIFVETPSNPMMKITNLKDIVEISKKYKLLTIVDNTFMTPFLQLPLELGADLVIHSGTKFLAGHNDTLCGIVVCRSKNLSENIEFIQNSIGAVLSPLDSFLTLRGIKTLHIRLEKQEQNAIKIVDFLKNNENITDIFYPGIKENPWYLIHKNQASGSGSVISFKVKNKKIAENLLNNVKIISFAESLGGVESLITYPLVQTHSEMPKEILKKLGIDETLIRLSVGIEDSDDLVDDLNQAME